MYHVTVTQTEDSGKGPFSKTPLSAGNRALFVSACFHLQCPLLVRLRNCRAAQCWLFLWHNDCLCGQKSAWQTREDTHINAVRPRGARGTWWAGRALRSRRTPLKHKQKDIPSQVKWQQMTQICCDSITLILEKVSIYSFIGNQIFSKSCFQQDLVS